MKPAFYTFQTAKRVWGHVWAGRIVSASLIALAVMLGGWIAFAKAQEPNPEGVHCTVCDCCDTYCPKEGTR